MISKIKENPSLGKTFSQIIGSEDDFFSQLKSENFKEPFLQVLQFVCEILESPSRVLLNPSPQFLGVPMKDPPNYETGIPTRCFSSMGNEDYQRLIEESDSLAKTLSYQKGKIAQICERVKDSMSKSKNILETPLGIRPASSLVRYERPYSTSPNYFSQPIIEEKNEGKKHRNELVH